MRGIFWAKIFFAKKWFFSCQVAKIQHKATGFCELRTIMENSILLFGGTFDPIHNAHVRVAECVGKHLNVHRVIFVPVRRSPHKKLTPVASDIERFEMIGLAIAGMPQFSVSDCELKRSEPSYTIDTIKYFRGLLGDDVRLCWLVGADGVKDLLFWHRIKELIDLCDLTIMLRGGFDRPDFSCLEGVLGAERVEKLKAKQVETPLIELSSTEIRQRLSCGEDVSEFVGVDVMRYIAQKGLYGYRLPKAGG